MTSRSKQIIVGGAMIGAAAAAFWYLTIKVAYQMGQDDHAQLHMTANMAMDAYRPTVYN